MKKLLFALAGAATFVAMADDPVKGEGDIEVAGFENLTAETSVLDYDDAGGSGASSWTTNKVGDTSLVKTYGGDNVAKPASGQSEPKLFKDTLGGSNYLALETNGAELQRKINGSSGQAVGSDGLYIDTLVQFTPSESAPSDISGAKLAIWLGVENDVTNLCVAGGYYYMNGTQFDTTSSNVVYKLSGTYDAGQWYRLTVKAVAQLTDDGTVTKLPGFVILVNGVELTTDIQICDTDVYTYLTTEEYDPDSEETYPAIVSVRKGLIDDRKFVPAMGIPKVDSLTLSTVGFQGSGAVDDLVVTTNDPFYVAPTTIDFTLSLSNVSAVKYVIGTETNDVTISEGSGTISVNPSTSFTLVPTLGDWYVATLSDVTGATASDLTVTMGTTAASGTLSASQFSADTTTVTAENAAEVAAKLNISSSAFSAAADLIKVIRWAEAKGVSSSTVNSMTFTAAGEPSDQAAEAYLLNCDNTAEDVAEAKALFKFNTFSFDGTDAEYTVGPENAGYNGTVEVRTAETVDGTYSTGTTDSDGKLFYKAYLVK